MDVIQRVRYAMEHYMVSNPNIITPQGLRGHFDMRLTPDPELEEGQWTDGDMTSRALDAWMYARLITGDYETGRQVEDEQFRYFRSLFNQDTGLVCVLQHSYPNRPGYYYHMWDQGRALKHLSNMLLYSYRTDELDAQAAADKMLRTLIDMSTTQTLKNGEIARYWQTDTYVDDHPIDRTLDYGRANFIDFTIACAQFLEPVVNLYKVTGEERYLTLAIELANGFIGGFERRRGSMQPMFAPDGAFWGHFHTGVSGLSGIVELAKQLYLAGNKEKAESLLNLAVKSYEWIFAEENINRGSSSGWFPEGTGETITDNSELCCTADMIELAASLAEASAVIPGYEALDRLWEDVERFTINELYSMQIIHPERFRKYLKDATAERCEAFDKVVDTCWGGWNASRRWLNEMLNFKRNGEVQSYTIGCCLYSGQRGLYSYLSEMAVDDGRTLTIRYAGNRETPLLHMTGNPNGGMELRVFEDRNVRVRIPQYIVPNSFLVFEGEQEIAFAVRDGYALFQGRKERKYRICWKNRTWVSRETVGVINNGYVTDAPVGRQITYELSYYGNQLTGVAPAGGSEILPMEGL